MARCSVCRYSGYHKEFWEKGCPKCASTEILALNTSGLTLDTFEEDLPFYFGFSAFILVTLMLFVGIINIEKGLFGSSQLKDDLSNTFYLWYFWLSVVMGALVGAFVGFKIGRWRKIKQKAREIEARDNRIMPSGANKGLLSQSLNKPKAQKEQIIKSTTDNRDRVERKTIITPICLTKLLLSK